MYRAIAPSLPPYPKLMFNPAARRAVVSVWHPTWQSHEWAKYPTEAVVWIVVGLFAWFLWPYLPPTEGPYRILFCFFATVAFSPIAAFFLRQSLRGFLARRIFPTKTVIWFTPNAIAFKSRLYAKPVVVWRKWQSQTVRIRFILQPDRNAEILAKQLRSEPKQTAIDHLEESQLLEMVLTTSDKPKQTNLQSQEGLLRTIPITEINSRLATRFTIVFAAAAALTAAIQSPTTNEARKGTDIDEV